jgi:hypothetical protein
MNNATCFFAIASLLMVPSLGIAGPFFFVTAHEGGQTQIDVNHSTVYHSLNVDPPLDGTPAGHHYAVFFVNDFATNFDWELSGAHLLMKKGTASTTGITFSLYEDSLTGTLLDSVTLTMQQFCDQKAGFGDNCQTFGTAGPNQYDGHQVVFNFANPVPILTGHNYIAVVSSDEPDAQNTGYFIKGNGDEGILIDLQGFAPDGSRPFSAEAPEPITFLMTGGGLLAAAIAARRRRRLPVPA